MDSKIEQIKNLLNSADAIIIGAGSGLSTSAGLTYSGKRFEDNFADFIKKYKIEDMYTGGFYPFESLEEYWAWWSRHIYLNRYVNIPKDTYKNLFNLVKDKNYFVITTNVDHCFQKSGFDKERLFYMQGDYGLLQCPTPCHKKTYDNEDIIKKMYFSQHDMKVDSSLVPYCPKCGKPMTTNLRCDDAFVEDKGWFKARDKYNEFVKNYKNSNILFLELGVGNSTPVWIKYPFIKMTYQNEKAHYVIINPSISEYPEEIVNQTIEVNEDIDKIILQLKENN